MPLNWPDFKLQPINQPVLMPALEFYELTKGDKMNNRTSERDIALMEANLISSIDAFFTARPHIKRVSGNPDSSESLFEAGFRRGWRRAIDEYDEYFPTIKPDIGNLLDK